MEIDRKELKRQARECIALADPKFWVVALAYLAMTTGVSWLLAFIPIPHTQTTLLFFQLLILLYTAVVRFGLCLWALWAYRQLNPGLSSLMQGFSVAGRVLLMKLGVCLRVLGWYFLVSIGLSFPVFLLLQALIDETSVVLAVLLFAVILLVILYAISLRYALAPYLLADRPDDGSVIPIRRSVSLMRGWKWDLFKLNLSFLGWELINCALSTAVIVFFLSRAGLLAAASVGTAEWMDQCLGVIYSTPAVILSTLVTVPVSLWLLPYRNTAQAGFYDARLLAASAAASRPEVPPL